MKQNTTKEQILEAALKLFAANGYDAVGVDQIAKAVGIKAPSLYKHYKSKRNIFESILLRMEQLDEERAREFEVPEGTVGQMREKYQATPLAQLAAYSIAQFKYWTEDEFASSFRKMLTLEQFHSDEICRLYQQYLAAGPLSYVADLFTEMGFAHPRELAVEFYAPMFLLYSVYDGIENPKEAEPLLRTHFDRMVARLEAEKEELFQ